MSRERPTWIAGDARLRPALEAALSSGLERAECLHRSPRRSVYAFDLSGEALALKVHHVRPGARGFREAAKALLGVAPAQREWRALVALAPLALGTPRPRALVRLANGDRLVVTDRLAARGLREDFRAASLVGRAQRVEALAACVARLHAAGWRHGDLHLGNLGFGDDGLVLFDLQRTRRLRHRREALDEIARLEHSLHRAGWPESERRRLRRALGLAEDALDAAARRFLRDHLRGRARRRLRPGRDWERVDVLGRRGMRDRQLEAEALQAALEAFDRAPHADDDATRRRAGRGRIARVSVDDRRLIVKRVDAGSTARRLADRFRGSAAARAFRAGQRHALAGDHAARPLAWLESSRLGLPDRSWLVLEAVGEQDLDRFVPDSPRTARVLGVTLGAWLAALHARGLGHRDLKGGNLRIAWRGRRPTFQLVDLEDLVGPRHLRDDERIEALSQLNASLADDVLDAATREAALAVYLERLPLGCGPDVARREIVRRSRARGHRWQGADCDEAREPDQPPRASRAVSARSSP